MVYILLASVWIKVNVSNHLKDAEANLKCCRAVSMNSVDEFSVGRV
jgi:hypothetical protein